MHQFFFTTASTYHLAIIFIAIGIAADNLLLAGLSGTFSASPSGWNWIILIVILFLMQRSMLFWGGKSWRSYIATDRREQAFLIHSLIDPYGDQHLWRTATGMLLQAIYILLFDRQHAVIVTDNSQLCVHFYTGYSMVRPA
jgi:hypothetical protein